MRVHHIQGGGRCHACKGTSLYIYSCGRNPGLKYNTKQDFLSPLNDNEMLLNLSSLTHHFSNRMQNKGDGHNQKYGPTNWITKNDNIMNVLLWKEIKTSIPIKFGVDVSGENRSLVINLKMRTKVTKVDNIAYYFFMIELLTHPNHLTNPIN